MEAAASEIDPGLVEVRGNLEVAAKLLDAPSAAFPPVRNPASGAPDPARPARVDARPGARVVWLGGSRSRAMAALSPSISSEKRRSRAESTCTFSSSTRREIMSRVNPHLNVDSNTCYFRRIHAGRGGRDDASYSVIINGLVRVAGKTKTGRLTYALTDEGRAFAQSN